MAVATRVRQSIRSRVSTIPRGEYVLLAVALFVAGWLILPALLVTIVQAFRVPAGNLFFEATSSWGISNFPDVYSGNRALGSTAIDTAIYTVGAVSLGFSLGLVIAWLIERTDLPFRNIVFVVLLFPLMMPAIVTTLGWIILLGPRVGLVNVVGRTILNWIPGVEFASGPFNITTMYGMIVIQGFGQVTLFVILLGAALRSMDPSLEDAARTSGASFLRIVRTITVPLLRPSVLGAIILATIFTVESFEVPLLLATGAKADILSTRVWELLTTGSGEDPLYGAVAAMGLHFMLMTYLLFYLYSYFTARSEKYATMTGKGFRARRYELGQWRWPLFYTVLTFLGFISFAPFMILVYQSFLPAYRPPSWDIIPEGFTLDGYRAAFDNKRLLGAVRNTVTIALIAPTVSVSVALIIAWSVVRGRAAPKVRLFLDLFTSSSLAIPAVIAAFAFFLFYLNLNRLLPPFLDWIPLSKSVLTLTLVYSFRVALAYRFQRAGVAQIAKELEEVSSTSGGNAYSTFRRILVPLVAPYTFGAWILLFLLAFREFTLPQVITAGSEPFVISTLVFNLENDPDQRAALAVLTVLFLFSMLVFARMFVLKRVRSF